MGTSYPNVGEPSASDCSAGSTPIVDLDGDVDMTPKLFETIDRIPHQRANLIGTQLRYPCIYGMPRNFAKNFCRHAPEWSDEKLMAQSFLLQCRSQSSESFNLVRNVYNFADPVLRFCVFLPRYWRNLGDAADVV
jgi:hypothetical protein